MSRSKAASVPTKPVEWEEELVSASTTSLQECQELAQADHLKRLVSLLPTGGSVIEAGCGLGQWAYVFASIGHTCVGFDYSDVLLARARRRAVAVPELESRVHWVQGTILDLPIGSGTLDCHASFGVLEHFRRRQQKKILSEAHRILKPGGILYLYVPNFWSVWTVRRQSRYWFRRVVPPHLVWQRNIRRAALRKMCAEAGFRLEHIQSFYAGEALATMAVPRVLARFVPAPIRKFSAGLAERLGRWCDQRDVMGYGLMYIGRKAG